MKSVLNLITQRESRVFVLNGPPGCGKTELISRVCRYWAKDYALREFSLVLYVNIWDLHRGCTLQDLIDIQFKGSTVSSKKISRWIQEEKGDKVLLFFDGFCHEYLDQTQLHIGEVLCDILSGSNVYSKSTVVIATTCSDFVKTLCHKYIQFEIIGLSNEQIGQHVIQHFDTERAYDFLSYLAGNPEIEVLVSSPSYLIGTMYVFAHVSYDDLPVTITQLYTSLVVLVNKWHERELYKDFDTESLQDQFKNTLLEHGRKFIDISGNLLAPISRSLIHNIEECDHKLPDHNSAVPYLQYFLSSLETLLNPNHRKVDMAWTDDNASACFYFFFAGLGVEATCKKQLNQYCQQNVLRMAKCLSESGSVTAEDRTHLSFVTAELSQTVITTCDVHSILHCLPWMQDPHVVLFNKCFLGLQAVKELSRFLAVDAWNVYHSGIRHLW